jgi:hypothetical protein
VVDISGDLAAIFGDHGEFAKSALYIPSGFDAFPIRLVPFRADRDVRHGASRFMTEGFSFRVRVSELAMPNVGDRLQFEDDIYVIQDGFRRDEQRKWWVMEAVAECV